MREFAAPVAGRVDDYMLDTVLFNRVLGGEVSATSLARFRLLATRVQAAELSATPNPVRRAKLLAVFETINPEVALTEGFPFDIEGAGFDEAHWDDGSGNHEKMLDRLRELDRKKRKREDRLNQVRDILIARTAIKLGATLVTDDCNLRRVASEFGGRAIETQELWREA
jgi:hypothetical protein